MIHYGSSGAPDNGSIVDCSVVLSQSSPSFPLPLRPLCALGLASPLPYYVWCCVVGDRFSGQLDGSDDVCGSSHHTTTPTYLILPSIYLFLFPIQFFYSTPTVSFTPPTFTFHFSFLFWFGFSPLSRTGHGQDRMDRTTGLGRMGSSGFPSLLHHTSLLLSASLHLLSPLSLSHLSLCLCLYPNSHSDYIMIDSGFFFKLPLRSLRAKRA